MKKTIVQLLLVREKGPNGIINAPVHSVLKVERNGASVDIPMRQLHFRLKCAIELNMPSAIGWNWHLPKSSVSMINTYG